MSRTCTSKSTMQARVPVGHGPAPWRQVALRFAKNVTNSEA